MLGGVADGGHNGRGRGQHQGAGAEHHQNGDGPDDLAGNEPRQGRGRQGDHHDPGGPPVGDAHDLGLARVGGLHQADHPLDGAVRAHTGGPHLEGTELVHGAAGHLVPGGLVHRQGFAGHDRLVDGGLSRQDHAVHRHALAGQHPQGVAHLHLLGGDHALRAAAQHAGRPGRQVHQLFDAGPGLGHRQLLQQAAQLHNEGHLTGGKVLADAHRGDQRQGHQHVRLDVKSRHQADDGLQHNGHAAQDDGDPRHIKGEGLPFRQAADHRDAGDHQQRHVLFDAAPLQQPLQFFHQCLHVVSSPLYRTGYGYNMPL